MHVVIRDCIVELDKQFILIIHRNRTVLVPTLSLNNDREQVCMWSYYTTEGTSTENPNCYHYNAFKNMTSFESIAEEVRDQRIYKLLLLLWYILLVVCLWIRHTTDVHWSFIWMQWKDYYLNNFSTYYVWLETGVRCRCSIRFID